MDTSFQFRGCRRVAFMTLWFMATTACDSAPEANHDRATRFHFRAPGSVKADGDDALLPQAEVSEIASSLENAISATETKIRELESEIARLEASHSAKIREIDGLLHDIAARKAELKKNMEAKALTGAVSGFFGFFFPPLLAVTAVSLKMAYDDDSRLDELEMRLKAARAARAALEEQRATYTSRVRALRDELAALRVSKAELLSLISASPMAYDSALDLPRGASPRLANFRAGIDSLRAILANNQSQIALLAKIRELALELGTVIDRALETVRALSAATERMLAESNAAFSELLALALAPDPITAAELWLEQTLAAETRRLLAHYEWPVDDFVDFLIRHRASGDATILADLRSRVLEAIVNAVLDDTGDTHEGTLPGEAEVAERNRDVTLSSTPDLDIPDADEAGVTDYMTVTHGGSLDSLQVEIEVRHSYVGDLLITLQKDGRSTVLFDGEGLEDGVIPEVIQTTAFAGVEFAGTWALRIVDRFEADEGRLVEWALSPTLR